MDPVRYLRRTLRNQTISTALLAVQGVLLLAGSFAAAGVVGIFEACLAVVLAYSIKETTSRYKRQVLGTNIAWVAISAGIMAGVRDILVVLAVVLIAVGVGIYLINLATVGIANLAASVARKRGADADGIEEDYLLQPGAAVQRMAELHVAKMWKKGYIRDEYATNGLLEVSS